MIRVQDEMQIFIILKRFLWTESRNRHIRAEESFSQHFHEILKKTERTTNNKNDFFYHFSAFDAERVSHLINVYHVYCIIISITQYRCYRWTRRRPV